MGNNTAEVKFPTAKNPVDLQLLTVGLDLRMEARQLLDSARICEKLAEAETLIIQEKPNVEDTTVGCVVKGEFLSLTLDGLFSTVVVAQVELRDLYYFDPQQSRNVLSPTSLQTLADVWQKSLQVIQPDGAMAVYGPQPEPPR